MTDLPSDEMPYALWVQDALRGVVRRALDHTAGHGLIGDHHFYITFRTTDDGVHIADHLRARHPQEMTIVLQHQFWDLEVGTEAFTVSLRFGGRLTPLRIPFAAITAFGDPSVNFGLQFSAASSEPARSEPAQADAEHPEPAPGLEPAPAQRPGKGQDPGKADTGEKKDEAGQVIAFDTFRKK